jgi:DNA end-binding protein Ku
MATSWKGSVAFGLVNIPVELKSAVRSEHISFRLLHAEDLSPVRYERVCEADGEVVPWREIVKGYEYAKGKFVVLTDEDFESAALEQSRTIEILDFVKEEEIDPRFPAKARGARKVRAKAAAQKRPARGAARRRSA